MPSSQPVDLLGRVVVDDPRPDGAVDLVEADPPHRLERVVVAPPHGDVAPREVLGDRARSVRPGTLKQNVGTRPSIVGRPCSATPSGRAVEESLSQGGLVRWIASQPIEAT